MLSLAAKNLSFTNELMTYYSYVSSQGGKSNNEIKKPHEKAYCYQHRYGAYRQTKRLPYNACVSGTER